MPPIYLHVGFPKTATTWLQHHLQESQSINYVGKYYGVKDRWASDTFFHVWKSLKGLAPQVDSLQVIEAMKAVSEQQPEKPIVLSDEVLAKPWKDDPLWAPKFAQRLHDYFPNAKILLTLRNQSGIACSLYRKYVENNGVSSRPMREWLDSGAGSIDVDFWNRWELLGLYQALNEVFGGNVRAIPYERLKRDTENYCDDIAGFFGLQSSELSVKRQLNKPAFKTDYAVLFRSIIDPRLWGNVPKNIKVEPKYDQMLLAEIKKHFEGKNRQLSELTSLSLGDYGYFSK